MKRHDERKLAEANYIVNRKYIRDNNNNSISSLALGLRTRKVMWERFPYRTADCSRPINGI